MPAPTKNPLTATVLSKVRPTDKPQEFRSQNVRGLVLRVQPSGVMTFYCQVDRNRRVRLGDAKVMTLTMAEAAARRMLLEGPPPTHGNGTLGEFVTASYAPHKRASEVRRIESVFADLLPLRLTEVTHARVEAWRAAQATAPATVNRNLVSLRAVLALAVRVGALTEHPLRTMRALPVAQGTPRYLSRPEYDRLLAALATAPLRLRSLVTVALETGCRQGELFGLAWDSVRMDERVLVFLGTNTKAKRTRYVPLSPAAVAVLKEWRPKDAKGYVWPGRKGNRTDNIRKAWATLLKRAGLESFQFKDLRSSAASHMVMNGVPLLAVSRVLGHTTTRITELHYAGLAPGSLHEAVTRATPKAAI